MFVRHVSPLLHQVLGIYLPLITTNCAVLGVALLNTRQSGSFIEARGKQVVVARGEKLRDPAFTKRLKAAVWNKGLPTPTGPSNAQAVFTGGGDYFIATRKHHHELNNQLGGSLAAAKQAFDLGSRSVRLGPEGIFGSK